MDRKSQLSEYFTLSEFLRDVDAVPELFVLNNLKKLALRLDGVRKRNGKPMRPSSGYRTARHNAMVGGEPKSLHLYGMAADFPRSQFAPGLIQWLWDNWAGGMGRYKTFVHLDIGKRRRWSQ
jgi:uncharacterized protein YcbK (DUF882 family)